jgi:hypothetical protein
MMSTSGGTFCALYVFPPQFGPSGFTVPPLLAVPALLPLEPPNGLPLPVDVPVCVPVLDPVGPDLGAGGPGVERTAGDDDGAEGQRSESEPDDPSGEKQVDAHAASDGVSGNILSPTHPKTIKKK